MAFKVFAELDERDRAILAERQAAFTEAGKAGVQVGDFVRFSDGIMRKVAYVWPDTYDVDTDTWIDGVPHVQTSDGGSFYLGHGYVSMSGSLRTGIRGDTLTDSGDSGQIVAWFFHHDMHRASNGVDVPLQVKVWQSTLPSEAAR